MRLSFSFLTIISLCTTLRAQESFEAAKNHFKSDIVYLSSDALEGRLAGSNGDKLSAAYISEEFKKAGLQTWNGSYFQTFDIVKLRLATGKCKFEMSMNDPNASFHQQFVLFEEFFPISESKNMDSVVAPLMHCGYGIEADTYGWNDYKNLTDLEGKIFIIQMGFPGDDTARHSPLSAYAEISQKLKAAQAHGAKGVIFIPGSRAAEVPKGELQRNASTMDFPVIYFKKLLPSQLELRAKIIVNIAAPAAPAYNVIGYKNNHKKRTVIICAHHDHLGYNEFGNSLYTGPISIHNGADDNASGVAAMLELARTMKGRKFKKNNYLFIAFSGEELGLLGSKYFIKNGGIKPEQINYVVNMDMVGRMDSVSHTLMVNGVGTSPVWNENLKKLKIDTTGLHIVTSESGLGPSDHASFYLEGIPVLHFFTGQHSDYHKPDDDESKINYNGMYKTYAYIYDVVKVTNKSGKLPFTKTKDVQAGRRAFKVTMGVMPDYTFTGSGMRIDGVSDGKPAQKAGLQKGDIITKLGDFSISNVQDYMKALGNFEKGMKTNVEVFRGIEKKTFEIEFQ
ncbi:MAG: M20/M25/M40 family metallo-hydrolase [Bacteroidetes bacterium]|nr:M20/M25/M40 family metallo-hydrolase [Bacteroidota bacterium]